MDVTAERPSWGCAAALVLVVLWVGTAWPILIVAVRAGLSATAIKTLFAVVGAMVVLVGTTLALLRRPVTTYVGELGVARIRGGAIGGRPEVLRFEDATHLYAGRTADHLRELGLLGMFSKGVRVGWTYAYTWEDGQGRPLMTLAGRLSDGPGPPRRGHPYHFARAAESAWSHRLIARARQELTDRGHIDFPVAGVGVMRLSAAGLELKQADRTQRFGRVELDSARVYDGRFELAFSDGRRFACPSDRVADLVVCVWALDDVVGISVN